MKRVCWTGTAEKALLSEKVIDMATKVYMNNSHHLCHARSEKGLADKPQLLKAKHTISHF
jgi:hypothetical protein